MDIIVVSRNDRLGIPLAGGRGLGRSRVVCPVTVESLEPSLHLRLGESDQALRGRLFVGPRDRFDQVAEVTKDRC